MKLFTKWTDFFTAFCLTLSDLTGTFYRSSVSSVDLHYILAISPPGWFFFATFTFAWSSHMVLPLRLTLFVKSMKGKRTSCLSFKQHMITWNLKMHWRSEGAQEPAVITTSTAVNPNVSTHQLGAVAEFQLWLQWLNSSVRRKNICFCCLHRPCCQQALYLMWTCSLIPKWLQYYFVT